MRARAALFDTKGAALFDTKGAALFDNKGSKGSKGQEVKWSRIIWGYNPAPENKKQFWISDLEGARVSNPDTLLIFLSKNRLTS